MSKCDKQDAPKIQRFKVHDSYGLSAVYQDVMARPTKHKTTMRMYESSTVNSIFNVGLGESVFTPFNTVFR